MSYATVLSALKTTLDAALLSNMEVSEGDYDSFNESHEYVVVLDYGGLRGERAEIGKSFFHDWEIQATIGVQVTHAKQAHDDIATLRQNVINTVSSAPRLGIPQTVVQAYVSRGEPVPNFIEWGGNNWQMEMLTISVREISEY